MVFGPKQIEQVVRGPNGLLSAMDAGQVWVDMTTNQPTLARALGSELAAKGVKPVDAPVTGAVDGARNGNMTQFAGGDEDTIERIRPVMELMGPMHYMGQSGSGSITKLASNQLWAIHATAMGEALVMAVKSGVELSRAWEAPKTGASESWYMHHDAPSVFAGHYDPSFTLDLCQKDLGLIVEACDDAGTAAQATRLVCAQFEEARKPYGDDKGELHVVKLEEDAAGVSLRMEGDWVPHWEKQPNRLPYSSCAKAGSSHLHRFLKRRLGPAQCEFAPQLISRLRRMSALTGRTAEWLRTRQGRLWAVLADCRVPVV